ncbi:MAG TPA: serine protease [Gammaproteobacteria bacterium]|nr:serine protease [Gammaproteobacteria bacterium]
MGLTAVGRALAGMAALAGLTLMVGVAAAAGADVAERLRANVVAISVQRGAEEDRGFGFIVGERRRHLYIITADHVVRGAGGAAPGAPAPRVSVQFFQEQGKVFPAELLGTRNPDLDVAVIKLRRPAAVDWQREVLGAAGAVGRGTEVWFVGRGGSWYVPVLPGVVNKVLNRVIQVDRLGVRPGSSGAPLISASGWVGMVTSDRSGELSDALSVAAIAELARDWNIPWQLRAGAVAPPSGSAPPAVSTGELCPRPASGKTGVLFELYDESDNDAGTVKSGECVPVAPGSYWVSSIDSNYQCQDIQVRVAAGERATVQLVCEEQGGVTPPPGLDVTGTWYGLAGGYIQIHRTDGQQYTFQDFNNFGVMVGEGTASMSGTILTLQGFNSLLGFAYSGTLEVSAERLNGMLVVAPFGQTVPVGFVRRPPGLGR